MKLALILDSSRRWWWLCVLGVKRPPTERGVASGVSMGQMFRESC